MALTTLLPLPKAAFKPTFDTIFALPMLTSKLLAYLVVPLAALAVLPVPAQSQSGSRRLLKRGPKFSPQQLELIRRVTQYNRRQKTPEDIAGTWLSRPGSPLIEENLVKVRQRYAFDTNGKYRRQRIQQQPTGCGINITENEVGSYKIDGGKIIFNVLLRTTTTNNPCDPEITKTVKRENFIAQSIFQLNVVGFDLSERRLCFGGGPATNCYSFGN